jgi:hypothetical protein
MDAELIAFVESPDAGSAPTTPTGLTVGETTFSSVALSWNAPTNTKVLQIERQAEGDVAWEVIEEDWPGTFTSYVDTDVTQGTTYTYRLTAMNIYGASGFSDPATVEIPENLILPIFEEHFEAPNSFGQFTPVNLGAEDAQWKWVLWDFGTTGAVQGNNFGASGPTEDWLISTYPINFNFLTGPELLYDSQISFGGPAPEVLYSINYDPESVMDPRTSTWEVINVDTTTFGELTPVGPFDLSAISSPAYLAWKYTGLGGSGGQSVRFTLDDVILTGDCGFDFEGPAGTSIENDASSPWTVFNGNSAFGWIYETRGGQLGAINNNFGSGPGGAAGGTESDGKKCASKFESSICDPLLTHSIP